jgi:hypothetical protein
MNIFIDSYLIALFIFLHFSLFLCKQPQCFFDSKQVVTLPPTWENILVNLFKLIPLKIEYIQLAAQFCLFGDIIFFGLIALKIIGNIIKNLLLIIGITCLIMFVLYGVSNYNNAMGEKIITEAKNLFEEILKKSWLTTDI